jgi:hypothetical protein
LFLTSIRKEEDVDFWGLLNPKERKNFGLYENGYSCPTALRAQENSGNLKRKH